MKDFKGGKSFGGGDRGGRPSFGGGSRFGGNDRGGRGGDRGGFGGRSEVTMHQATCSECGKRCEVPFRPTGEKPVYCNDCFGSKREGTFNDRGNDRGGREDRPSRDFSKPSFSKPATDDRAIADLKKEIETVNSKLDAVIKMIQSNPFPTAVPAKKESLKTMVEKTQAPAKKAAAPKAAPKKVVAKVPAKKAAPKKAAPKKK